MPPRTPRRASPARVAQRRRSALLWLSIAVLVTALVALPRDAELPPVEGDLARAEPGRAPPAEPVWTNLAAAAPLFTIAGTRPAPSLTRYQTRIQAETGAREDSATYGAFESGPYLRVDLSRSDAARPASHFVDLARRAAARAAGSPGGACCQVREPRSGGCLAGGDRHIRLAQLPIVSRPRRHARGGVDGVVLRRCARTSPARATGLPDRSDHPGAGEPGPRATRDVRRCLVPPPELCR
jgi:hypothetical protein